MEGQGGRRWRPFTVTVNNMRHIRRELVETQGASVSMRAAIVTFLLSLSCIAHAEDGYDLWLRYRPVESGQTLAAYRRHATQIVSESGSPTLEAARRELSTGLGGLLGEAVPVSRSVTSDGAVVIGTPASSALIKALGLDLSSAGKAGYVIRSVTSGGRSITAIAGNEDVGVLHGVFHFLRLMQTRAPLDALAITSAPAVQYRVLDHWDNLDGTVERGYAGASLWDWHKLPDYLDPRYERYARACASIGINGSVLTNVNANAISLTAPYIAKAAALAGVFRPYGIRVYLTAKFSAPIEIGGLKTADPLDASVKAWWRAKADEIYRAIPDFGGFLVKANSEGQPGPQDYHRTHADGANMLADAVGPHGGIIMWRAFVYSNEQPDDRAKQAYSEFVPLDGKFRENVLLQVKNGAIDFQPREPFHPLFGAMPKTPLMLELQITKEYLGFATHLAYLAPLFEETLSSDTFVKGKGSTVAKVIDGSLHGYTRTGIAGVANVGRDRNWSGSEFDQANWYAFGRLAWKPTLGAATIAEEWARMTFSNDSRFLEPVVRMMMGSREAVVDYMTPLGLHHLMASGHHYGPGPWISGGSRADWTPVYYHRADSVGIGFDRSATGSNAVAQYSPEVAKVFGNIDTVPEKYLLWFHHVPWDHRMASGRTLWDELVVHYTRGVETVHNMRKTWASLAPYVDAERHAEVAAFLAIQEKEAKWWRDACIAYFQSFSKRPLPEGYAPPTKSLQEYEAIRIPYAPGHPPADPPWRE
jgi:alpha-glucuronidase